MREAFTAFALIVGFTAVLGIALNYGEKWVDRMLHYDPPDPTKPIVRRLPE